MISRSPAVLLEIENTACDLFFYLYLSCDNYVEYKVQINVSSLSVRANNIVSRVTAANHIIKGIAPPAAEHTSALPQDNNIMNIMLSVSQYSTY